MKITEKPVEKRVPNYRRHRQSGQAIVTLTDGLGCRRDVLLGKYGTRESRQEYARVISEWESSGRRLPGPTPADLTNNELVLAYWTFAEGYYRKNGKPTKQLNRLKLAFKPLRELYGMQPAANFGPKCLKAVRETMLHLPCGQCRGTGQNPKPRRLDRRSGKHGTVCGRCKGQGKRGWARKTVNTAVDCIKRLFQWAVGEELVTPAVYHGLLAVKGLRKGRTSARETPPVRPVPEEHIQAVLPFLSRPVRAMVELQKLSGMRPGEVCIMRPADVDRSQGKTWVYRPESHKTEHHNIDRVIFLGPRAQAVLAPFLLRAPENYCFSPLEAVAELRERQRRERKTPVQPSQVDRRKRRPRRQPREVYSVDTYGNAIERACLRAGVPSWNPNQLRHFAATLIRREADLDSSRVILGHRSPRITEVYAEIDVAKASTIMEKLG